MTQEILKLFMEKGFLLDKEILNFLRELDDIELVQEIISKIVIISKEKVVSKDFVIGNFDKFNSIFFGLDIKKKKIIENFFMINPDYLEDKRRPKEILSSIENDLLSDSVFFRVLSPSVPISQTLETKDFVKHFRNRYVFLRDVLQIKPELDNLTSIDKIGGSNNDFSIIGIVSSKRITKNKNIVLDVEDLTGKISILVNHTKEKVFGEAKDILLDDVIGFRCNKNGDFVFVNNLYYPDSSIENKKTLIRDNYALFLSDIHLGSSNFLRENFEKFISWLNGEGSNEKQKEVLKKIKYLFILGDSVDGVGVYPGQEKDLIIKDIREQYIDLARYLDRVPRHIQIIQCAGQHDAVRVAEPQPPIGVDFAEPLYKIENLKLVSNPSLVEIGGDDEEEGIKVLMYHGASIHGVINEIQELRINNAHSTPTKVVAHLLKRRHLAPSHGPSTIYIPNKDEDLLLIKEIPDIVATGNLHRTDIDTYNNILIISCSCWQSITAFGEKIGNSPDPCKVPILNLNTQEVKILDFS